MLRVPALNQINNVTIFEDDALFYKYYLIAAAPSVRLDENKRPVFLLVKYALSDEDRIADPSLPPGGGYLNFDIQFDINDSDREEIRKQLQLLVDARWQQLKNGTAAEQAMPGVAGSSAPPKVEFGTPTWTGGKVTMHAPQAAELVDARVAEAEPSLLSGNIAVFNMDLSSAGATFMQRTLVEPNGEAIDLTPVQIKYDLKFWARLPSVLIHIKADSEKIHNYIKHVFDGYGWYYYHPYNFRDFDTTFENIVMSGAIDVQIDTGSGSLSDEVIDELRNYAMDLVKQMIQSSFFSSEAPTPPPGEENSKKDEPAYYHRYFKQDYDASTMTIELNLEQRSVVEWMIHPQTTLETFFHGLTPDEIKQYVRSIDLQDDFFSNLQLEVRAFTDFADPNIANVEVEVHYAGKDENNLPREKNQTFTFVDPTPQQWSVGLIGSQREYQYRYRVGFKGQEANPFTSWEKSKSPDLNISAPNPGKIDLTVLTGDIDYDTLVDQVQVRLAYSDPELVVPREEGVVILNASSQQGRYLRTIFQPQRKPIEYLRRFRMKSGDVREDQEWKTHSGPQLMIDQPFTSVLEARFLPGGDGWEEIVSVLIDLKYEDMVNNYVVSTGIQLKSKEEFRTWKVSLRNRNVQQFDYRYLASYKNGHLEDSGWQKGTGSGVYPVIVKRQGIKIMVIPETLDFSASPLSEVHLRYNAAGLDLQETLTFRDKTPQSWSIDVPQGAPLEYTYQVTHYPVGGMPHNLPPVTEYDSVVVVPPYRAPNGGRILIPVFATLIDFTVTPLVTVDLRYDDDVNNVHEVGALTFSDNKTQTWEVAVKDLNQKQYGYTVTYFTADGQEHPQTARAQEIPRIIIPKYVA